MWLALFKVSGSGLALHCRMQRSDLRQWRARVMLLPVLPGMNIVRAGLAITEGKDIP